MGALQNHFLTQIWICFILLCNTFLFQGCDCLESDKTLQSPPLISTPISLHEGALAHEAQLQALQRCCFLPLGSHFHAVLKTRLFTLKLGPSPAVLLEILPQAAGQLSLMVMEEAIATVG